MQGIRKSQVSSAAIVLGLTLFSMLLAFNSNLLTWPVGSDIKNIRDQIAESRPVSLGILQIVARVNETYTPSTIYIRAFLPPKGMGPLNFVIEETSKVLPLAKIPVSISAIGPSSVPLSVLTNPVTVLTNSTGEVETTLPPNEYTVSFEDWRLNNLSVNLQVFSGQVTRLNVDLNASSYGIQFLDVEDPVDSGWVSSWAQVFALLPVATPLTLQGENNYLGTNFSAIGLVSELREDFFTPVSITNSMIVNNSEWIQLQLKEPLQIDQIQVMYLVTMKSSYTVNITAH